MVVRDAARSSSRRGSDLVTVEGVVCTPVLLRDRVVCDFEPSRQVTILTDTLTCEQHERAGRWELVWDESGDGCIAQDGDDGGLAFVDELFSTEVVMCEQGRYFIKRPGQQQFVNFTTELRRYEDMTVNLKCQAKGHALQARVYRLLLPRHGFHCLWCLTSIYRCLQLTQFKGFPSKWFYESYPSWKATLEQLGVVGQLALATGGLGLAESACSSTRFLPTGACTSLALLWLLVRWSLLPVQRGGFRDEWQRLHAREMLMRVLEACCKGEGEWNISVVFDDDWTKDPPRPTIVRDEPLVFPIVDGRLDISVWRELVDDCVLPRGHCIRKWWRLLDIGDTTQNDTIELGDFMQKCLRRDDLASIARQTLWAAASRLEEQLLGDGSANEIVSCGDSVVDSLRGSGKEVDLTLVKYVESMKLAIGRPQYLSLATDKASIKGLSLSNAVAVTSSNVAGLLPPQVASHWGEIEGHLASGGSLATLGPLAQALDEGWSNPPRWCIIFLPRWCIIFRLAL